MRLLPIYTQIFSSLLSSPSVSCMTHTPSHGPKKSTSCGSLNLQSSERSKGECIITTKKAIQIQSNNSSKVTDEGESDCVFGRILTQTRIRIWITVEAGAVSLILRIQLLEGKQAGGLIK